MSRFEANPYVSPLDYESGVVASENEWARTTFIRRTYLHLTGAIAAFVALEGLFLYALPDAVIENLMRSIFGVRYGWLLFLGGFMVVSFVAEKWARSTTSLSTQYAGLGLYVVAEAVLMLPLLYMAERLAPQAIPAAAVITATIFTGLTGVVFMTRADFSWMGRYLCLAGLAALAVAIASVLFGFSLGLVFSAVLIVLASGYILYDTSNVLHHYRTEQYVAAALALFASVALLFWYVLRLLMILNQRD